MLNIWMLYKVQNKIKQNKELLKCFHFMKNNNLNIIYCK